MMSDLDDRLVCAAVRLAAEADAGTAPSESVLAVQRATALTLDEAHRHRLEREARARSETLGAVGLQVLRVALALA